MQSTALVVIEDEADCLVLHIRGELDADSCPATRPAILAAIESASSVVVDLSLVTFCDSQALSMFIEAARTATERGTEFAIRGASAFAQRLFKITGVDEVITILY